MSASSIGAGKASGYARYLESKTVEPERGDYYLTPDGQLTEAPGRWLSGPETLSRLGIQSDQVEGRDFIALTEARDRDGHPKRAPRSADSRDPAAPGAPLSVSAAYGIRSAAARLPGLPTSALASESK
jgi:hypothetical protein